jgi:hypothetical protein
MGAAIPPALEAALRSGVLPAADSGVMGWGGLGGGGLHGWAEGIPLSQVGQGEGRGGRRGGGGQGAGSVSAHAAVQQGGGRSAGWGAGGGQVGSQLAGNVADRPCQQTGTVAQGQPDRGQGGAWPVGVQESPQGEGVDAVVAAAAYGLVRLRAQLQELALDGTADVGVAEGTGGSGWSRGAQGGGETVATGWEGGGDRVGGDGCGLWGRGGRVGRALTQPSGSTAATLVCVLDFLGAR